MARRKKEERQVDKYVMWKSVLISGIVLGLLFGLIHLFLPRALHVESIWYNRVLVGLKAVALWLVVSSTVRALNQLRERMPGWQLAVGGMLTAVAGGLIKEAIVNGALLFRGEAHLAAFDYRGLAFFTGLGLLFSIVTMINLRVKNRLLGNVLEVLVIVAFLVGLIYFVGKN